MIRRFRRTGAASSFAESETAAQDCGGSISARAARAKLTQLPNPEGLDENAAWSPDGKQIAFAHAVPPVPPNRRWRFALTLLDVASGKVSELPITGIQNPNVRGVAWADGGKQIAFVANGRIWIISSAGGAAKPITEEGVSSQGPSSNSDGRRIAYFAPDAAGRNQILGS
jgi:Tol biopolymer transport system component